MTLDKLLKENAAWLEQVMKQPLLDRIDAATQALPETQRQLRIAALQERVAALALRRDQAIAAYENAIAQDKAELEALASGRGAVPPVRAVSTRRAAAKPKQKPKPKKRR